MSDHFKQMRKDAMKDFGGMAAFAIIANLVFLGLAVLVIVGVLKWTGVL